MKQLLLALLAISALPSLAMERPSKIAKTELSQDELDKQLHLAVASSVSNYERAIELIQSGADMESRRLYGETPLAAATARGDEGMVKLLIAKGADVNTQNGYGITPLMMAVRSRNPEITMLFLKSGANIFLKDCSDRTALDEVFHEHLIGFHQFIANHGRVSRAAINKKRHYLRYLISHSYCTPHRTDSQIQEAQALTRMRIMCMKNICPRLNKDVLELILKVNPEVWQDACATPLRMHSKRYDRVSSIPIQTLRTLVKKRAFNLKKTVERLASEKLERIKLIMPSLPINGDRVYYYGLQDLINVDHGEQNFGKEIRRYLLKCLVQ